MLLSLLKVDNAERWNSGSQYRFPACYRASLCTENNKANQLQYKLRSMYTDRTVKDRYFMHGYGHASFATLHQRGQRFNEMA